MSETILDSGSVSQEKSFTFSTLTCYISVCWFGFAGWLFTWVFIPDTTGLDLREQDRYWSFVRAGRPGDYHGIAVHPRHLSVYERFVLKRHLAYDAEKDRAQRVEELRVMYEERRMNLGKEGGKLDDATSVEEDDELSSSAASFFSSNSSSSELQSSSRVRDHC